MLVTQDPDSDIRGLAGCKIVPLPPDLSSRTGYPAERSWLAGDRMQFDQRTRPEFIAAIDGGPLAWLRTRPARLLDKIRALAPGGSAS